MRLQVGQQATQQLAANLLCNHVRYQAALRAATGGMGLAAKGAMAGWGKQAVLEVGRAGAGAESSCESDKLLHRRGKRRGAAFLPHAAPCRPLLRCA